MADKVSRTDAEWRALLTPEQYRILREQATKPEAAYRDQFRRRVTRGAFQPDGEGAVVGGGAVEEGAGGVVVDGGVLPCGRHTQESTSVDYLCP